MSLYTLAPAMEPALAWPKACLVEVDVMHDTVQSEDVEHELTLTLLFTLICACTSCVSGACLATNSHQHTTNHNERLCTPPMLNPVTTVPLGTRPGRQETVGCPTDKAAEITRKPNLSPEHYEAWFSLVYPAGESISRCRVWREAKYVSLNA